LILIIALALAVGSCSVQPRYNSLDLDLLPCEQGDSPVFFQPVEFDKIGNLKFPEQRHHLLERLRQQQVRSVNGRESAPVTDLIFFVHGWNKNPASAEVDYQNFICRLHGRLRQAIGERKDQGGLLVIGVFWPSTITNRPQEPLLVKPASYFRIRRQADHIAKEGLAPLLQDVSQDIAPSTRGGRRLQLHLIGHSFGGRMLVESMHKLDEEEDLVEFLSAPDSVNVLLLNPAIAPESFAWIGDAVSRSRAKGERARFTDDTGSYLFNVHSRHDSANRILFRLASLFNDDPANCAAGACGVPCYPSARVNESGGLDSRRPRDSSDINAWNIDATPIVFGHSDIYKGRVASLVANLLYDAEVRASLPSELPSDGCND